jgi:hypothetical protein
MAARSPRTLRLSLLPLVLLASSGVDRCEFSTAPGTFALRISGTIHFLEAEGGCWQLETADGRRFELRPAELPEAARRDGARVTLLGIPRKDIASVCQGGTVFEVDQVLRVEEG